MILFQADLLSPDSKLKPIEQKSFYGGVAKPKTSPPNSATPRKSAHKSPKKSPAKKVSCHDNIVSVQKHLVSDILTSLDRFMLTKNIIRTVECKLDFRQLHPVQ